ncbi:MAG TPA: hypothetical protein VN953_09275, partial [Gemmatimonadales bacterium]|nr:hypothetical protein [Gemmatimonadales bacterium]
MIILSVIRECPVWRKATGGSGLRIQPVDATFYALAREEDVANGIQIEDLLYGSSEGVDVGSLAKRRFIGN